jgi:hypothetical protein
MTLSECSICHEALVNEPFYTLPECNHSFHTNCIMNWFRNEHTCPVCRSFGYQSRVESYTSVKKLSRQHNAPKEVTKYVNTVNRMEARYNSYKKELESFYQKNPGYRAQQKEFMTICKKIRNTKMSIFRKKRSAADILNIKNVVVIQRRTLH